LFNFVPDESGKTFLLYKLKLGEAVTTIPTIGFNVENVLYKGINLTIWDVGGQAKIRPLWRHYLGSSHLVIWTVDASKPERFAESQRELHSILQSEQVPVPLLVFANKMDLGGTVDATRITQELQLPLLNRVFHVQPCSAMTGDGLYEGLDWISSLQGNQSYQGHQGHPGDFSIHWTTVFILAAICAILICIFVFV